MPGANLPPPATQHPPVLLRGVARCFSRASRAGYRAHPHTILVIMQPSGSRHGVPEHRCHPDRFGRVDCESAFGGHSEMIAARTAKNAGFPRLVEEAEFRRARARRLAAKREKRGLSQTAVATMMGTSPRLSVSSRRAQT